MALTSLPSNWRRARTFNCNAPCIKDPSGNIMVCAKCSCAVGNIQHANGYKTYMVLYVLGPDERDEWSDVVDIMSK